MSKTVFYIKVNSFYLYCLDSNVMNASVFITCPVSLSFISYFDFSWFSISSSAKPCFCSNFFTLFELTFDPSLDIKNSKCSFDFLLFFLNSKNYSSTLFLTYTGVWNSVLSVNYIIQQPIFSLNFLSSSITFTIISL